MQAPILATAGTGAPFINGGDGKNTGIEVALSWNDKVGELNYGATLNFAYNKNKVTRIANTEGIICAIESAHAVAHLMKLAPTMNKEDVIICCLSGRGDKDVAAIARYRGIDLHE